MPESEDWLRSTSVLASVAFLSTSASEAEARRASGAWDMGVMCFRVLAEDEMRVDG